MKLSPMMKKLLEDSSNIGIDGAANNVEYGKGIVVRYIYIKIFGVYNKLRNAVDNKDKEFVRRYFISRILKKLLKKYDSPVHVSTGLIYMLISAGYLQNGRNNGNVLENIIRYYQELDARNNSDIFDICVNHIESFLYGRKLDDLVADSLYLAVRDNIDIVSSEEKGHIDTQVYIACLRSLFGNDINNLKYALLLKYVPDWNQIQDGSSKVDVQALQALLKRIEVLINDNLNEIITQKIKDQAIYFMCIKEMLINKELTIQTASSDTINDKINKTVSKILTKNSEKYKEERKSTFTYILITKMGAILPLELLIYVKLYPLSSCAWGQSTFFNYLLTEPAFVLIGLSLVIFISLAIFIVLKEKSIRIPLMLLVLSILFVSFRETIYSSITISIGCGEFVAIIFNAIFHPIFFFLLTREYPIFSFIFGKEETDANAKENSDRVVRGVIRTLEGSNDQMYVSKQDQYPGIITEIAYIAISIVVFGLIVFYLKKIVPTETTIVFIVLLSTVTYFAFRLQNRGNRYVLRESKRKSNFIVSTIKIVLGEIGAQLSGGFKSINMFGLFMDTFVEKPFIAIGTGVYDFIYSPIVNVGDNTKKSIIKTTSSVKRRLKNFVSHVQDKDEKIR